MVTIIRSLSFNVRVRRKNNSARSIEPNVIDSNRIDFQRISMEKKGDD